MDTAKFDALVAKHNTEAINNPNGYKFKVFLLALFGNAYITVVLIALVGLVIALIGSIIYLKWLALKALIFIGPIVWMILKSLNISIDAPEGLEITRKDAPELFALIHDLQKTLKAPRFHHVLLTHDFNAAVVQSPRLGLFGWYRNYLLIGLPLMQALSTDQFRAVLAHEFGHLARGHGRMSNWIYRQRFRWSRLLDAFSEADSKGAFLFKPFLNWFSPYFSAFTFPLARANEYTADALCASATSPQIAAQTLTRVEVIGHYLSEKFWPQIHQRANDEPSPKFSPYQILGERIQVDLDEESIARWLNIAMEQQTSSADTHPSLKDRLQAINESPAFVTPSPNEFADQLLGPSLARATEHCSDRWQSDIFEHWRRRFNEVQESRTALAQLEGKLKRGEELSLQEAYDRALYTESVGNDSDSALAQLQALLIRAPDDAWINFALGARLLNRNDESGLPLLERSKELNESLICRSLEALRDYHWRNDRKELAHALHEQLIARAQLEAAAEKERQAILISDHFEPQVLTNDELNLLIEQLRHVEGIKKAYLVKKRVKHLPHQPLYLFGFTVIRGFGLRPRYTPDEILHRINTNVQFSYSTFLINLSVNRKFGRKIKKVEKAEIF